MIATFSWTQPCCDDCWKVRCPDRGAHRFKEPLLELCVDCGEETRSGIYIRVDPAEAKFPTNEK